MRSKERIYKSLDLLLKPGLKQQHKLKVVLNLKLKKYQIRTQIWQFSTRLNLNKTNICHLLKFVQLFHLL